MPLLHAAVADEPLDLAAAIAAVSGPAHGAVATFVGQVRDHDPEAAGEVLSLDYSCHPDAPRLVGEIARRALATSDPEGAAEVWVAHRVGHLAVGDLALVAAVGSAHRDLAFDVCRAVVEAVKHELPVWKRQTETTGTHQWVGLGC